MRRHLVFFGLALCMTAHAADTLRVGSSVLAVGDSAAKVRALLGNPSSGAGKSKGHKTPSKRGAKKTHGKKSTTISRHDASTATEGERWQYRVEGHTAIITMVNGKVAHIDETID